MEHRKPVDADLGYVRIEIGDVARKLEPRKVQARVGDVYRPLLNSGEILVRLDRAPVVPTAWPIEERHDFSVRAGRVGLTARRQSSYLHRGV